MIQAGYYLQTSIPLKLSHTNQPQNNPPYHTTPNQLEQQLSVFVWGSTASPRPEKK
ncbi:hypothetical protein L873DRAFT_1805405 [Choiromyces venosus 120613-1]|uniref:Uncharacterized protein n=1 Tax=Choiromyces venosus 120613-1 TaxID=1336337 RepID=A0A3N4JPN5_9PEZI|nr:hypothetical protein L873DRAFT_1805405 [Choiromyces venosus 120613-1]